MQTPLRIENVLSPRLIEADRNLMSTGANCPLAIGCEAPRTNTNKPDYATAQEIARRRLA